MDDENDCRNNLSLVIVGFVIVLLFDCIIKLFPWDGERRRYWG
jgi:hypothetical protein